ncbi:hypothetical protein NHQ30_001737 [Ciborinia camelliae]|nr:hypothetical protein NHQ30_001737 [Ciborinia camelliae]
MFEEYYKPIMDHILASIGFSIPVYEMFASSILWKGIFYAILMFLAKASVGIVLYLDYFTKRSKAPRVAALSEIEEVAQHDGSPDEDDNNKTKTLVKAPHLDAIIVGSTMIARGGFGFLVASEAQSSGTLSLQSRAMRLSDGQNSVDKLGSQTLNVVEDQIFLVIIWALVLCTIAGPIVSGIAVRRKLAGKRCECGLAPRTFGEDVGCHLCL